MHSVNDFICTITYGLSIYHWKINHIKTNGAQLLWVYHKYIHSTMWSNQMSNREFYSFTKTFNWGFLMVSGNAYIRTYYKLHINAMFLQVTPYMQLLVFHIADFIKQFSCQGTLVPNCLFRCFSAYLINVTGVENRMMWQRYLDHRKSNRWDFIMDLLQDDYLMHELRVCETLKQKYR